MNKIDYAIAGLVVVTALMLGALILYFQNDGSDGDSNGYTLFDRSSVFTIEYPEAWVADIVQPNHLVSGPPETVRQNPPIPGPSFSVLSRLAGLGDDIMQGYIDSRLFREGSAQEWELVTDITDITIDDTHAGQMVEAVGTISPGGVELHTRHIITRADNNVIYVFVLSAPVDEWDTYIETFDYMVDSLIINE